MGPGGVGGLGGEVVKAGQGDVQDEALDEAGEVGASPELEGVAQAEVEDLGVWGVRGLTRLREPWEKILEPMPLKV